MSSYSFFSDSETDNLSETSNQDLDKTQRPIGLTTPAWMFWSSVLSITAIVSATMGAVMALLAPETVTSIPQTVQGRSLLHFWPHGFQYRLTRPVNILIMGIDRVPGAAVNSKESFAGRSDTLLVLRLDPTADVVSLVSIPRDTRVLVTGSGWKKINYVNPVGGAQLTSQVVSSTLNDLPIDRYLRISSGALQELVDLLGGVEVFVPYPMSYTDYTQDLKIELVQGWQWLNGEQADHFAKFRSNQLGDIGRVQRQQVLIKAIKQRLTSPLMLPRLPQALRVMEKYVDTDISSEEMLALVTFGLQVEPEAFKLVMLPGRYSYPREYATSYWVIDGVGRDRVLREYFHLYWLGNAWNNPAQSSVSTGRQPTSLRIAIQNATGKSDITRQVVEYLVAQGFEDLYLVEDWGDRLQETEIVVQKGDLKGAKAVQDILGFGKIEATSTGDLASDLTIRIGQDWVKQLSVISEQ